MKILILNWKDLKDPEVGGAEIITFEMAKRLVKKGHQITWFSRQFTGCLPAEEVDGVKIIRRGGLFTTYLHGWWYYKSLKEKPDLVIDMLNTIFWQTPLYVKQSRRLAYVNQLAQEVFFYELPPLISHFSYWLERLQFLTYRKTPFLVYSNSTKSDLVKMGIPEKNISIFSMGLDHTRYFPGEKSKEPLFLCVSRLVKMKRTDMAIKAMAQVVREFPEAKLAIVGYGYERKNLEILRNQLKLERQVFFADENVLFFEKTDRDQKVRLMQQAWALVFSSVKEGWGMTVTECAACGTPAIVTDVTGLRDSVVKDKTGLVVSASPTISELASAMEEIIRDDKLREELSQNALAWSQNFSWEKSFEEFNKSINGAVIQKL